MTLIVCKFFSLYSIGINTVIYLGIITSFVHGISSNGLIDQGVTAPEFLSCVDVARKMQVKYSFLCRVGLNMTSHSIVYCT